VHQTIENIICTFSKENMDEENRAGILGAMMFATRATYHTTLQASPTQPACLWT
jgi:hypothetical protein